MTDETIYEKQTIQELSIQKLSSLTSRINNGEIDQNELHKLLLLISSIDEINIFNCLFVGFIILGRQKGD